jgi:hypothetical protein
VTDEVGVVWCAAGRGADRRARKNQVLAAAKTNRVARTCSHHSHAPSLAMRESCEGNGTWSSEQDGVRQDLHRSVTQHALFGTRVNRPRENEESHAIAALLRGKAKCVGNNERVRCGRVSHRR